MIPYVKPENIVEAEEAIAELEKQKEEAITNEEYEKAGEIKKQRIAKMEELEELNRQWAIVKDSRNLIVDEEQIAEVVSDWTKIAITKLALVES